MTGGAHLEPALRLTVLLTTYNHARFIEQALDSVLSQQTAFDFEVVVLDDGSTDGTQEIVRCYAESSPKPLHPVFAAATQCSNEAFMRAFLASDAEYIALLDGDDFWTSSSKLQHQVDFLDANASCSLCFHNVRVIEENRQWNYNGPQQKRFSTLEDLWFWNFIAGCSPVVRRKLLTGFPDWYEAAPWGDLPLYILLSQHGSFGYIDEIMGCYRRHTGGLWSGLSRAEQLRQTMDFYDELNRNLDYLYNDALSFHIGRLRRELRAEQGKPYAVASQSRWQATAGASRSVTEGLADAVRVHIPEEAQVSVVTEGDASLLVLDGRHAHHFIPHGRRRTEEHTFATARSGAREVSWIREATAYDFRVHPSTEWDRPLAALTVSRSQAPVEAHSALAAMPSPFVRASPNPLGVSEATTTVSWDTGDDEYVVSVWARQLEDFLLYDSAAALEHLEVLRAAGFGHVVVPAHARWWLDYSPDVRRHLEHHGLLVTSNEACDIYTIERISIDPPPSVAVVIPCYNHGRYLAEAVDSVLAQTYPSVEVIVVDDGSTDNTGAVAKRYREVQYLWQPNSGLSSARNAGMAATESPLCLFLDADDRLLPRAVETAVRCLGTDPAAAFVSSHCTLIAADGSPLFTPSQLVVADDPYCELLRSNFIWNPASVLYRRSVLEAFGGFNTTCSAAEDYEIYLRITRQLPVHCLNEVTVEYRQHASNMSGESPKMADATWRVLRAQADNVIHEKDRRAALQAGMLRYDIFYRDEQLCEMRRQIADRLLRLETVVTASRFVGEQKALTDEIRDLYRSMLDAYSVKTTLREQAVTVRSLQRCNEELKQERDELAQRVESLSSHMREVTADARRGRRHVEDLRRAIDEHLAGSRRADFGTTDGTDADAVLVDEQHDQLEYYALLAGIRDVADRALPGDATVLVVTRGDDELLDLDGRSCWHFPQVPGGIHAGSHPASAADALAHLDALASRGANFLLVPQTECWWFDAYPGFEEGLRARGSLLYNGQTCIIYRIGP